MVARRPNPLNPLGGNFHLMMDPTGSSDELSHTLLLTAYFLNPASKGEIRLAHPQPRTPPVIRVGYLSDPDGADLAALRTGVRLLREIAAQPALCAIVAAEHSETAGLDGTELDAYIRENFSDYAHPVGTCRMGSSADPAAVADARGVVRGTRNVIVADASATPTPVSANTNLTAMLLGYKLAGTALGHG
ncbi:MAG: GMC oxidoreductase [bacterium]